MSSGGEGVGRPLHDIDHFRLAIEANNKPEVAVLRMLLRCFGEVMKVVDSVGKELKQGEMRDVVRPIFEECRVKLGNVMYGSILSEGNVVDAFDSLAWELQYCAAQRGGILSRTRGKVARCLKGILAGLVEQMTEIGLVSVDSIAQCSAELSSRIFIRRFVPSGQTTNEALLTAAGEDPPLCLMLDHSGDYQSGKLADLGAEDQVFGIA